VVCIAGGPSRVPEGKIAPTLVMAAELDPIFPPRRLEQGAKVARERGLPVEVQVVPSFGHTLVVGARLPQAVEWLMGKRLAE
jgi:predicted esterase